MGTMLGYVLGPQDVVCNPKTIDDSRQLQLTFYGFGHYK